jgi:hypothetical protein
MKLFSALNSNYYANLAFQCRLISASHELPFYLRLRQKFKNRYVENKDEGRMAMREMTSVLFGKKNLEKHRSLLISGICRGKLL